MARPRWIAPWKDSPSRPAIYHLVSRVVDRRMAFGPVEKEKFRSLMRVTEAFSGCRVLAYCLMSNHFHILLEVPPPPGDGLPEALVLRRLGLLHPTWKVREIEDRLTGARQRGDAAEAARLLAAHTYRMHDLSEFMKTLLQRFSSWFNRSHGRRGRLWEQRFKSVLVEDGLAARTIAAYIDLNPVRAGLCEDPSDYRWSSYAEAVAGGRRARAGLVRVLQWREGTGDEATDGARPWTRGGLGKRYREVLLGKGTRVVAADGTVRRRGMAPERAAAEMAGMRTEEGSRDPGISRVIRHRVRHFTDGAVIGGRPFVEQVFRDCRHYFGAKRKDGARKPRGALAALAGDIWSARDLGNGGG